MSVCECAYVYVCVHGIGRAAGASVRQEYHACARLWGQRARQLAWPASCGHGANTQHAQAAAASGHAGSHAVHAWLRRLPGKQHYVLPSESIMFDVDVSRRLELGWILPCGTSMVGKTAIINFILQLMDIWIAQPTRFSGNLGDHIYLSVAGDKRRGQACPQLTLGTACRAACLLGRHVFSRNFVQRKPSVWNGMALSDVVKSSIHCTQSCEGWAAGRATGNAPAAAAITAAA